MKTIRPVNRYKGDRNYPARSRKRLPENAPASTSEKKGSEHDRRAFLGTLVSGVAAGVATGIGTLFLPKGVLGVKKKTYKATFYPTTRYVFRPCMYRVYKLTVETKNAKLANFVLDSKNLKNLTKWLNAILKKHDCKDITNAKKLARLERKLAKGLASYYYKKTKRRTKRPIVTLHLQKHMRRPLPGIMRPPRP